MAFIGLSVGLALVILWLTNFIAALPFILIAAFVVQFSVIRHGLFRKMLVQFCLQQMVKLFNIEKAFDDYQQVEALKISVFMNVFNVHSNRSPVDGEFLMSSILLVNLLTLILIKHQLRMNVMR